MTIDLNQYRHVIAPMIKLWVDNYPEKSKLEIVDILAKMNSCHLVAVGHYMGELYGFDPELVTFIEDLSAYYHVDEVLNKQEVSV